MVMKLYSIIFFCS